VSGGRGRCCGALAAGVVGAVGILSEGVHLLWAMSPWWITSGVPFGTITSTVGALGEILAIAVPIILLPQVFPDGVMRTWWARWIFGLSLAAVAVEAAMLAASAIAGLGDFWGELAWASFGLVTVFGCLVGMVGLGVRFAASPPLGRRQILAFGLVHLALNVYSSSYATSFRSRTGPSGSCSRDGPSRSLGSILLGVVRHHLYDVRIVVRRVARAGLSQVTAPDGLGNHPLVAMCCAVAGLADRVTSRLDKQISQLGLVIGIERAGNGGE
jgi:hypothetical protein